VIHYDLSSPASEFNYLAQSLLDERRVLFAERVACRWGEFSIVQGTINCLERLKKNGVAVDYVYLLSGSDLPIRPLEELRRFLHDNDGREFIESFPIDERRWLIGGNQEERFLYRFPFNKRRRKGLFRAFLLLQRWLGMRKRAPAGMRLCLGGQFWCLSWPSCQAILDLCSRRPSLLRFFRTSWIPDESFFQTLVRCVAPADRICTETLTHYEFDSRGRPLEYTDADRGVLEATSRFFARKIALDAEDLRRYFRERAAISSASLAASSIGKAR
jgi:hypothetical protein